MKPLDRQSELDPAAMAGSESAIRNPQSAILSGDALIAALKATGLSNERIGAGIGKSGTTISQYLNRKYPGDVPNLEARLREWLRDRRIAVESGITTIDTEASNAICKWLEEIRCAGELALIIGPAGVGKTRGQSIFLLRHTLAIAFRSRPWHSGMHGLAMDLSAAASIDRLTRGENRWETICRKTAGTGRLLFIDDAQELSQRGMQCGVDWHEQTGNPACFFGLPSLKEKFLKDSRRARRIGEVFTLTVAGAKLPKGMHPGLAIDPKPLVNHLVSELAPDANGERVDLSKLCHEVALRDGHFGAVEKQLHQARRIRKKKPGLSWVEAFRAAHLRLLRSYTLS